MASSINASTTAGVVTTADTSGVLNIQTAGTTAISIDASQAVSFTNSPTVTGGTANGVAYLNGSKVLTTGSALVFDGSNLGVGVTPSAWISTFKAIQVGGGASVQGQTNSVSIVHVSGNAYVDSGGTYRYIGTGEAAQRYQQYLGAHSWYNAPSGTAGNAITFTQAMTLDASGNLGIGVTPSYKLHVASSSNSNNDVLTGSGIVVGTTIGLRERGASAGIGGLGYASQIYQGNTGGGHLEIYNISSTYGIIFGTQTTERARIDSSGNLLVGQTTQSNSEKFGVVGSNAGPMIYGRNTSAGGFASQFSCDNASWTGGSVSYFGISGYSPNNTARSFLYASDSTALRFQVYSNGGLANYSANNVNLSDRREKTNFAPATSYLDKICAIPVQTFNYIDQNLEEDAGLTLGVVAQDVQAVAPELVMESDWGTTEEPKMRLSIYQTDLQYALMKCIQEQQALITQLQADVAALKGA